MTRASTATTTPAEDCGCTHPEPTTPVLLHRRLRPNLDTRPRSIFDHDRWDLTPGIFEAHAPLTSVNFANCPTALRPVAKRYMWELINHAAPRRLRAADADRLAVITTVYAYRRLRPFLLWLGTHDIDRLDRVTPADLDRFLAHVLTLECGRDTKADYLTEVRRLWCYRARLPEMMRLPATPPWGGEDNRDLIGHVKASRENATPRIHPDTMQPLLMWSLRFVEDFADDILGAFTEYQHLRQRDPELRNRDRDPRAQNQAGQAGRLIPIVTDWVADQRDRGGALPGIRRGTGELHIHWRHLSRVFGCAESAWTPNSRVRNVIINSGLPVAEDAYLETRITAQVHDRPWRTTPIAYTEAFGLVRMLMAACAVTIAYLSGMRPGELLNLKRDCAEHDPVTKLWLVRGQEWKDVVDAAGEKVPEGTLREAPWTVIEPVTRAIDVLQRLHPHLLLFSVQLREKGRGRGANGPATEQARRTQIMNIAVGELVTWINRYCAEHGLQHERIPADPSGPLALSRFRRTLAWHIVRRPRGLVAGAFQYGHLYLKMTLGYAGTYDSGFPDDYAFEDWLYRVEQLAELDERLAAGEHVSGPAADIYRHRVPAAVEKFAGRVLTSGRQARDLLENPLLEIYPGKAMTCVFDPTKALCKIMQVEDDTRRTPDLTDCHPNCRNVAYTDPDIAKLQARARSLRELTRDPVAPSIRNARDRHELERITEIIRNHHGG